MRGWCRSVALILSSAVAVGTAVAACPERLRVGFIDAPFPPMLMGAGAELADPPGWSVLAVQEAARRLGCKIEPVRMPARRLELFLQHGLLEFSLFLGATPERLSTLRFPLDGAGKPDSALAPLVGHLVLYAPVGSAQARPGEAWDGRSLSAGTRVGVVAKSTQEQIAVNRGWPLEFPGSFDIALQMLRARRFDLLLTPRETMRAELLGGEGGLVELSPVVQQLPYFVVASPRLWEQHADFVRRFWREACLAVRRLAPEARPSECGVPVSP
jgi:ABC-type amino acid transport substrate-binding protein